MSPSDMNLSLYNIANEFKIMVERLMDSSDDAQTIADTIEAESFPLENKAQSIAYAIKNINATVVALKHVAQETNNRIKSLENREQSLKNYVVECLEIAGIDKVSCEHFEIKLRKNPPSIDVFDPDLLPESFMRQPELPAMVIDKGLIKTAIAAGQDVPGARIVQSKRIEIK